MGEATYYGKITFKTTKAAKEGLEKIKEYLDQHTKAYNAWQTIRKDRSIHPDKRYRQLKDKFPLAFSTLPKFMKMDDSMNPMAAHLLNFSADAEIRVEGKTVLLSALVWHFDNWDHLVKFAHTLGAKAGWTSDEYEDTYFEQIKEK